MKKYDTCQHCGHRWIPKPSLHKNRKGKQRRCPKCERPIEPPIE